jgi:hypothetical protein
MARRSLVRRRGTSGKLSRHLASRRALQRRMRATTPIRFLQRLNLLPEEEEQPIEMRLWDTLDHWLGDPAAETDAHALADLPANEVPETFEAPRSADPITRAKLVAEAERRDVPPARDAVRERPRLPFRRAVSPAGMRPAVRIPVAPVPPAARQPSPEPRVERRAEYQEYHASPALPVIPVAPSRETPSRELAPMADSQTLPASLRVEPIVPAPVDAGIDVVRRSIAEVPAIPASRAPIEPPGVDSTDAPVQPVQTWAPAPSHIAAAPAVSERVSSPAASAPDRVVGVPAAPRKDFPIAPIARQDSARPVDVPSIPQKTPPTSRDEVVLSQSEELFADLASAITDVVEAAARVREEVPKPPPPVARPSRRARVEELPVERPPVLDAERPPVLDAESADSESPVYRSPAPRGRPLQRRPAPPPEPPRDREGDRLFQPTEDGIDRSPAAWAARLAESMRPASRTTRTPSRTAAGPERGTPTPSRAAHAPTRPRPAASPVQLSQATRRFLKPLVGIDPASVTILQGPLPSAVTSAHRADALAIGDDTILVGSAFVGEMPRDLGLLAHELTHIARERRPRFIPPAARASRVTSHADPSEESLARRVESRVVHLARSGPTHSDVGRPGAAVSEALLSDPSPEPSIPEAADAGTTTATPRIDADWGGLPAPWEPLPEWLAPSTPGRGQAAATFSPRASQATSGAVAAAPVSMAAPARVSVQRAEEGRELDAPEQASPAAPAEAPAGVAPDLDLLARQVYAVLKRRLETETRREQMF